MRRSWRLRARSGARPFVFSEPESSCAQLLHIGPYDAEGPDLLRLDAAIDAAGLEAVPGHVEVYVGDPRRAAPERLRTLLRRYLDVITETQGG